MIEYGPVGVAPGIFIGTIFATIVITVLLFVVPIWRIFTKAGRPGWASFIPLYNLYVLVEIINKPKLWFVLLFVPGANVVIQILMAIELARVFGKSSVFGFLFIFLLPPIGYFNLAYGSARYIEKSEAPPTKPESHMLSTDQPEDTQVVSPPEQSASPENPQAPQSPQA